MAETTLNSLVMAIARRLGNAIEGTATGGSTTTLVDTVALWQPNDSWNSHFIRILTGANAGVERLVTDHVQSTKTLTLDPALSYTISAGDQYQVTPVQYQHFLDAIRNGIAAAGDAWVTMVDDATTLTWTGAQEYSLPADLLMIHQLWAGDGTYWDSLNTYEVIGTPGAYKLMIRSWPAVSFAPTSSSTISIRILYSKSSPALDYPTSTLGMGSTADRQIILYLQEMALKHLHERAWSANLSGETSRANMSKAQMHLAEAERIKRERKPAPLPMHTRNRRYADQI